MTTYPNMGIEAPDTDDSDYPTKISDSFNLVDAHDHSSGKGVAVQRLGTSAADGVTLEVSSGAVRIKDAGVTGAKLGSGVPATNNMTLVGATSGVLSWINVGEYVESKSSTLTAWSTNGSWGDIANISLTTGEWDISAMLEVEGNGSTITAISFGVGTASGTSTTGLDRGNNNLVITPPTSTTSSSGTVANYRVTPGSTTTYYLKLNTSFSVADPRITYRISARRVR